MRYAVVILTLCLLVVSAYADTPEEMLAILMAMDDAIKAHDTERIVSYYAEDAITDCPPFEPYGKQEEREVLNEFFEIYPTFSLANNLYLASDSENVGIVEHTSIYTVNGLPIAGPHICAQDFEGGKMKRLTIYLDYAMELIQSGVMPRRNLGDMIPSFPLPASEATGLAPMEASAELLARLNSHDLSNAAKMLRSDVDVWYPFISRQANRSEFIDIHEQFLGGFSDLRWENVRRVDMRDGWVYSEAKLIGINDGEFLGKPATGLPMEVRSGLIEHYDENGLATYVHFHFDTLSVPGQATPVDEVKEQMLALMMELEDAYNAHDSAKCASFFTEDIMVDCPPYEPYPGAREAGFDEMWEMWPNFSLANPIHLASSSEKVGVTEHSDLYSHPDTGTPLETPHLCVKDYNEELKAYKLTIYGDWIAEELIQGGLMLPRKLGDMLPSFSLPAPEATGFAPMEASAEFMARLNSGDLQSTAKMLRSDVNVLFPFINREATRSEFIDIYEQILGGFSDAHWETIRRMDMGDGWVYFEGTLKGTNDGEFLGKPATGLPMDVRGGWVEHYDENGLATYLHAHFDSLSMPGQEAPTGPVDDFSNVFFTELTPGLNMISVPLKPITPYTARSFADITGSTLVIKYDKTMRKFVGFDPKSSGDGFDIEGGQGYIVNVPNGGTVSFTGAAWTNEPSAELAPPIAHDNAWAFMVSGLLSDGDFMRASDGIYTVRVKNLRTGETFSESVGVDGYFTTAWADLGRSAVIKSGDKLEIAVMDAQGVIVSGPLMREIKLDNIRDALVNIPMKLGQIVPKSSLLLHNYPNPFNPETWIPFHLSKEADVSIRIFNASGKLVRTLSLGRKEPGLYVDKDRAVHWDGKNEVGEEITSGIYFYTITAGEFSATRKMIVKK